MTRIQTELFARSVAVGIVFLWATSLFLPALKIQPVWSQMCQGQPETSFWYDGEYMFLTGLKDQFMIFLLIFAGPGLAIFELPWLSNAMLAIVVSYIFITGRAPNRILTILPLVFSLISFAVSRFSILCSGGDVVDHGSGFWIWLVAMALPLAVLITQASVPHSIKPSA